MAEWENRLRRAGQDFKESSQNMIKKQVDDPILRARRQREIDAQAQMPPPRQEMPNRPMPPPEVPSMEGQSPEHQDMRMRAMLGAAENMKRIKEKEAAMRMNLEAEDAQMAQDRAEFDPSQYQRVPTSVQQAAAPAIQPPARFGGLKARMQQQAAPPQSEQVGAIELSEDPEEMQRQIESIRLGR